MVNLIDPSFIEYEDAMDCLREIQQILFPKGSLDKEWDSDTASDIAAVLFDAGLWSDKTMELVSIKRKV